MSYSTGKNGDVADGASKTRCCNLENERNLHMTRRVFMRTVGIGAAALALTACGGGSSSAGRGDPSAGSPPSNQNPGTNTAPLWSTVPTIAFTEGVAATFSVAAYVSDSDSLIITKNSAALPPGVTYDSANKSFIYDGNGAVGSTDGHVLTAVEV